MRIASSAVITRLDVLDTNELDRYEFRREREIYYVIPKTVSIDVEFEGLNHAAISEGSLRFNMSSPEASLIYKMFQRGYPIKLTMEVGE